MKINWDDVVIYGVMGACILALVVTTGVFGYQLYYDATREPYEGKVVSKHYEESQTTYMPQTIGKTTTIIPITDDEDWVIMLDDGTDKRKRVEVSEKVYENVEIGEYFKEEK